MRINRRMVRVGVVAASLVGVSACASGGLGNVLGSVLGGGQQAQSGEVDGTVTGIDTRSQRIGIQQQNGQNVAISYDNQTQVSYQNRNYAVTSLENGDQIAARLQNTGNGGYYTDYIQVVRSVSNSQGTVGNGSQNVQQLQGTVRQVDRNNGFFTIDDGNGSAYTVSLPYRPNNNDVARFQSLRPGDYVRFYGVILNNYRVELRQFN